MTEEFGTKLLTITIDLTTYKRLREVKGIRTWAKFLQDVSKDYVVE